MNKIIAVAFSFAAAAAFSPAFAQTAASTTGSEVRIAPASAAEERDVGIAGYSQRCSAALGPCRAMTFAWASARSCGAWSGWMKLMTM